MLRSVDKKLPRENGRKGVMDQLVAVRLRHQLPHKKRLCFCTSDGDRLSIFTMSALCEAEKPQRLRNRTGSRRFVASVFGAVVE